MKLAPHLIALLKGLEDNELIKISRSFNAGYHTAEFMVGRKVRKVTALRLGDLNRRIAFGVFNENRILSDLLRTAEDFQDCWGEIENQKDHLAPRK